MIRCLAGLGCPFGRELLGALAMINEQKVSSFRPFSFYPLFPTLDCPARTRPRGGHTSGCAVHDRSPLSIGSFKAMHPHQSHPPLRLLYLSRLFFVGTAAALVMMSPCFLGAQESLISLQQIMIAAEDHLEKNNIEASRYYLTSVQKLSKAIKPTRSGSKKTQEYYELWWVRPNRQREHYVGVAVTTDDTTWQLSPSEAPRKNPRAIGTPKISLKEALNLAEAFALQRSLITPAHYLHSASLVARGRSAEEIYWYVWLKKRNGAEKDDVQLGVRMDGSILRLGLM